MNKKLTASMTSAVSVAALTLLTSCGGGSSGGGSVSTLPTTLQFLRGAITEAGADSVRSVLPTAAAATPTRGSVTQAASASTVAVTVTPNGDGLNYGWRLETQTGSGSVTNIDSFSLGRTDVLVDASNSLGEFRNIGMRGSSSSDGSEYYVSIFHDHEGGDDEDYIAGGFWLHVTSEQSNHSFGAFADGSSPFNFSTEVSGSSTYSGKAAGLCDCAGASGTAVAPRVFEANAELDAVFGGSSTISGTIDAFVVDGVALAGDAARSVSLMHRDFSSGFFTGDTSLNGTDDHGEWGGEFYGVRDADNTLPGSVGGTFGATDGAETFVGAFGAHHVVAGDADSGNGDTSGVPPTSPTSGILGSGISAPLPATQAAFRTAAATTPNRGGVTSFGIDPGDVTQAKSDLRAETRSLVINDQQDAISFRLIGRDTNPLVVPTSVSESRDLNSVFDNIEMQMPSDDGQYYLSVLTDNDLTDSTLPGDYVAAGFWLHVPETGSAPDVSFGAFADGNRPFTYSGETVSAVSNTAAVYSGVAVGAYCECAESAMESGNIDLFDANVTLTANFTSNEISGRVTDFQVGGSRLESTIYLQSAPISTATDGGGFFTGETSLTASDDASQADDGKWGGAFYGAVNGASAPASAAGTFGASSDTHSYLGAFGASLE